MKLRLLPSIPFVWLIESIDTVGYGNHPLGLMVHARSCLPVFETRADARKYAKRNLFSRGCYRITRYVPNSMLDMTSRSGTKPTSSEKES